MLDDGLHYMLTTIDNPYDPFTQWDEWFAYDEGMGYHTCAYIDRVCLSSDSLPDSIDEMNTRDAMKEIADFNLDGLYKLVSKPKENE